MKEQKKEIIIRISSDINIDDLQDFTDYLQYKEISKNSKANQSNVDELVKEVKKGRWEKRRTSNELKSMILKV